MFRGYPPLLTPPHFVHILTLFYRRKTDIFMDFLNGGSKEGVSPKHRPKGDTDI